MSLKDFLICVSKGFFDSLKGTYWLYNLDSVQRRAHSEAGEFSDLSKNKKIKRGNKEEPRLLNRVLQCCGLNGIVFGLSIILFNNVLLPLLQKLVTIFTTQATLKFWSWLQFFLQWTFDGLWVLPLFVLSRIVNALWFQDIGTLAYRYTLGRPKSTPISTFIADNLFSFIIQFAFLLQAVLLQYLLPTPLSQLTFLLHTCLLYSLYSFEYKWVQMGMPLHQRLNYIEQNWPYFLGFGMPLSLLTFWSDFVISGCLFAIFFPLFIIGGNEGEVGVWSGGRLRVFSLVVRGSNWVVNKR